MIVSSSLWVAAGIISVIAIYKGSIWLEESSQALSTQYGVPLVVKGAIITAFGSSFPELSSVVLATLVHGEFDLGVGSIVGSAIFNILVIPAIAGIYASGSLQLNRKVADKEAKFYMVAVSVLIAVFSLSAIYNRVETEPVITATITPLFAMIPVVLYGVYIFDQWQEVAESDGGGSPPTEDTLSKQKAWGFLLLSLGVTALGVEALVRSVLFFGEQSGIPSFVLGAVIVAGVTSIPDTVVSIRQATDGQGVTSLANVFGSNTFDLLIAVPIGVILAGGVIVNFSAGIVLLSVLVGVTVVVFVVVRTSLELTTVESYLLLGLYGLFIVWISIEGFQIINTIPNS